jgi:hypothetical protein
VASDKPPIAAPAATASLRETDIVASKPAPDATPTPATTREAVEPTAPSVMVSREFSPTGADTTAVVPAARPTAIAAPAEPQIADKPSPPPLPETRASAETSSVAPTSTPTETTGVVPAPAETTSVAPVPAETTSALSDPAPTPTTLSALDGVGDRGSKRQQVLIVLAQPDVKSMADLHNKVVLVAGVDSVSGEQLKASFAAAGARDLDIKQGAASDVAELWAGKVAAAVVAVAEPVAATAFHEIPGYTLMLVRVEP